MRRIIKPFAVEIRGAGRRTRTSMPETPVWPDLAEQPRVAWPEPLLPPAAVPEPIVLPGRVLPDLSERETEVHVAEDAPAEAEPLAEFTADQVKTDASNESVEQIDAPLIALCPAADADSVAPDAEPKASTIGHEAAAHAISQQRLLRPSREDFRRGDKWKVRLRRRVAPAQR